MHYFRGAVKAPHITPYLPCSGLLKWPDDCNFSSKLHFQISYINIILHIKKVSVRNTEITGKT